MIEPNSDNRSRRQLLSEIEDLRSRLTEAEDTLQAIREGEVDAIVVSGSRGEQVFSLTGTEHVYRLIVETMSEAALTVSFDGRVLFCNRQFARLLQISQEHIVGRRMEDLVPAEDRRKWPRCSPPCREGTVTQRLVFQGSGPAPVPVHLSAVVLHTTEEESICIVATDLREIESSAKLIGQLRRQQEALEESEHRWVTTLASIGDAVIATDPAGRITFMNAMAQQLTGWTMAASAGKEATEVFRIVSEETREEMQNPVNRILESGKTFGPSNRTLLMSRSGTEVPIDVSCAPIRDDSAGMLGAVLVFRDIRVRRQAEEALRSAKKAAENANQAKSEFLAHMSHEIRTPLSAIIGLSQILETRISDAQNRKFISMINDSARSMLNLLGEILDFSKIEAGKVELDSEPFDLSRTLQDLIEPHALLARQKGIDLKLRMDEDLTGELEGDAELLSRVLHNLLSNAVKYTERGEVRLEVCRWQDGPADHRLWILFSVVDTGIGIPENTRERLFESFERLHGSLTRIRHEGTGLGLAIAKKLVELMGGEIGMESTEGVGSRFFFTIPFRRIQDTTDSVEQNRKTFTAAFGKLSARSPLRVLLAEDNQINRIFLRSVFEENGHRVETVENGQQALDVLRETADEEDRFNLVLMDIQMPVMDGIEAIRAIRRMEGEPGRVPVIALTAFAAKEDEHRFRELGADGYISKPVDFERLADEIRRVLSTDRGAADGCLR